jgi:hypothetical protein
MHEKILSQFGKTEDRSTLRERSPLSHNGGVIDSTMTRSTRIG